MARHLVLAGGGAKGAYQAGVLQVIHTRGIKFDSALGISVGALNAAGVAIDDIPKLLSTWRTIREDEIIKRGSVISFVLRLLAGYLPGVAPATGLHDTRPLRDAIERFIAGRELKIPLFAGRVGLNETVYQDKTISMFVVEQVWRSTLVPLYMRADVSASNVWVDGGVHNVTPLKRLVEYAADGDEVVVVLNERRNTPPKGIDKPPGSTNAIDIVEAVVDWLVDMQFERDLSTFMDRNGLAGYKRFEVVLVEPSAGLGSSRDYSRASLDMRIDLGIKDATKQFSRS